MPNSSTSATQPQPMPHPSPNNTDGLRDIKAPIDLPDYWRYLVWMMAAVAAAILLWQLWRWWKHRQSRQDPAPLQSPRDLARERLKAAQNHLDDPRAFTILVSDTVRWYFEAEFNLRAPERTTEEFLDEMRASSRLSPIQKQNLSGFLEQSDLVKFARYQPTRSELDHLFRGAELLIEESAPSETAPPNDEGAAS